VPRARLLIVSAATCTELARNNGMNSGARNSSR